MSPRCCKDTNVCETPSRVMKLDQTCPMHRPLASQGAFVCRPVASLQWPRPNYTIWLSRCVPIQGCDWEALGQS